MMSLNQKKKRIMIQKPHDQTFFDHLDEFKGRLIKSILAIVFCSVAVYFCIDELLVFVVKPIGKLVFTSPADAFLARITLSLLSGVLIALPFVLFQIWLFVSLGLKENESKFLIFFVPVSVLLFILGACFAYFIMIPICIKFLLGFSTSTIVPMITIGNYISFMATLIIAFGIIFELPLVLLFLTLIGIATPEFLMQKRSHAVVLILIISALITPPDFITQLIMAGPLIILYELGLIVAKITYNYKKHKELSI